MSKLFTNNTFSVPREKIENLNNADNPRCKWMPDANKNGKIIPELKLNRPA